LEPTHHDLEKVDEEEEYEWDSEAKPFPKPFGAPFADVLVIIPFFKHEECSWPLVELRGKCHEEHTFVLKVLFAPGEFTKGPEYKVAVQIDVPEDTLKDKHRIAEGFAFGERFEERLDSYR
jgi:hypothetical protein